MLHLIAEITEGPAHPNLWNPTILGVLVVLSAIGLFCGSTYLLLATNLGARLGFLVAFASLTGFMVLLSTLWWTSGNSGIDPPHGRSPSWKVVDVVSDIRQSKIEAVQNIATDGRRPTSTVDSATCAPRSTPRSCTPAPIEGVDAARPAVREVRRVARLPHRLQGLRRRYIVGGGTQQLLLAHAEVRGRAVLPHRAATPAGEAPVCDPLQDKSFAILQLRLRLAAPAGGVPVLDPVGAALRPLAARSALVRVRRAQEQEARGTPVPVAEPERLGGRPMASRATADRREQGRRRRLPVVRDHGVPLRRLALLHGPRPQAPRRAEPLDARRAHLERGRGSVQRPAPTVARERRAQDARHDGRRVRGEELRGHDPAADVRTVAAAADGRGHPRLRTDRRRAHRGDDRRPAHDLVAGAVATPRAGRDAHRQGDPVRRPPRPLVRALFPASRGRPVRQALVPPPARPRAHGVRGSRRASRRPSRDSTRCPRWARS